MGKRILIVDDSEVVRQQVAIALGQAGYEPVEAVDGADGLSVLEKRDDIEMVICDVNMPVMDGLAMVEQFRKTEKGKKVPVMMLTTEGDPSLIKRAKAAGAKGWMVKPFDATLLIKTVNKITTS